jgi:hypothetical protein
VTPNHSLNRTRYGKRRKPGLRGCIISGRAYGARLRRPVSSNVRRQEHRFLPAEGDEQLNRPWSRASPTRGFRNRERFRNAIDFHLGGLDRYHSRHLRRYPHKSVKRRLEEPALGAEKSRWRKKSSAG